MIRFAYQLASTAVYLVGQAARVVGEETGIIADRWEWAVVHLMGQKTLYGQVRRSDTSIEVMAFDPSNNDIPRQTFHGWQAVYSVDIMGERDVRREYVESVAGHGRGGACSSFLPSSVSPDLCKTCAFEHEYHMAAMAQAGRVSRYESMIREAVKDPIAVVTMRGEDGERYDGTNGLIEYVKVTTGGNCRQLTEQEWDMARQAGVRLAPYGSQDPDDDKIPF